MKKKQSIKIKPKNVNNGIWPSNARNTKVCRAKGTGGFL